MPRDNLVGFRASRTLLQHSMASEKYSIGLMPQKRCRLCIQQLSVYMFHVLVIKPLLDSGNIQTMPCLPLLKAPIIPGTNLKAKGLGFWVQGLGSAFGRLTAIRLRMLGTFFDGLGDGEARSS